MIVRVPGWIFELVEVAERGDDFKKYEIAFVRRDRPDTTPPEREEHER